MKKTRILKKLTALALSVVLIVGLMPVSAFAEETKGQGIYLGAGELSIEELKTAELDSEDIPEILRDEEIEEKDHVNRLYEQEDSLNSVMFQNRDGTKTKYLYNTPVKYVDDKGETQDKSNAIYTTLFGNFETRENDITSYFPKKINQNKGVEISFKEYTVEMSPDIKGNSGASRQTGHNKYGDPTDYVQYPDVFDEGISVRYTPTFDGLKEDIILEEYTGINEFTFILRTDGLKLYLDENGIPKLSDPETNEVLIDLGALYIYDSGDKELFGDWNHKYILETVRANEEYKITVSVDKEYLTDPERVYPVYVDPSATLDPDGLGMYKTIMDAAVYDGSPNETCGGYPYGVVGYDSSYGTGRLLMKFPGLLYDSTYSGLTQQQIQSLDLHFFEGSGETTTADLDAYFYLGDDWNEASVTKNTMSWEGFVNYISTASVYDSDWHSFDLMPAVNLWKSASDDIYKGIIIKNYTNEAHQAFAKTICTTESGYQPYLSYTFDEYAYTTISLNYPIYEYLMAGEDYFYAFTPPETDYYTIYTEGNTNTYGDVYNLGYVHLTANDNSGVGDNFKITIRMEKGCIYYIKVCGYSASTSGDFSLHIKSDFINKLQELHDLAKIYTSDSYESVLLVSQFIRREAYSETKWSIVAGTNQGFSNFVEEMDVDLYNFFTLPTNYYFYPPNGDRIDFTHLMATYNALLYETFVYVEDLAFTEDELNHLCGWAGDLRSMIPFVMRDVNYTTNYTLIYNETLNHLGGDPSTSLFSMPDLLADVDAYNLFNSMNQSSLKSTFEAYYLQGGTNTRFSDFVGDLTRLEFLDLTRNVMNNSLVNNEIFWPLKKVDNTDTETSELLELSDSQLNAICNAFVNYIWDKVEAGN